MNVGKKRLITGKDWRTPLAILRIGLSATEVRADGERRGALFAAVNQFIPDELTEEIATIAGDRYDRWLSDKGFRLQVNLLKNTGYSDEEAKVMAFQHLQNWLR